MHLPRLVKGLILAAALAFPWVAAARGAEKDAGTQPAEETPAQRDARMKWFREARFGLFIHWGVYSVPAGQWKDKTGYGEWFLEETKMPVSQYEQFARRFNPVKFDAKQWVAVAKNAGMKYLVITSKHHDGFGMFRSGLTDWCIKSTPSSGTRSRSFPRPARRRGSPSASTTRSWTGIIPTGAPAAPGTTKRPPRRPTWTATPRT